MLFAISSIKPGEETNADKSQAGKGQAGVSVLMNRVRPDQWLARAWAREPIG